MLDLKIKVNIQSLIKHLVENKKTHIVDYDKAMTVYFEDVKFALADMTKDIHNEHLRDDNYCILLRPPILNKDQYDKYIHMLNMSNDDEIEIGTDEYERFVEDTWDWARAARSLNATYSSKF